MDYINLVLISIPSAFTGLCFWLLERKISDREKRQEEREKVREQNELLLVKSVGAAIALGEASAIALKNGHTNGETEAALEYARQVKHEQKDFLYEQSVKNII
nr:serine/threonine protein kinase [uncultured Lachnoclostridium sp.]